MTPDQAIPSQPYQSTRRKVAIGLLAIFVSQFISCLINPEGSLEVEAPDAK